MRQQSKEKKYQRFLACLCRQETLRPSKLTKMQRNLAKIYQKKDFHSIEGHSLKLLTHVVGELGFTLPTGNLLALYFCKSRMLAHFVFKNKMWQVLRTSCWATFTELCILL